MGVDAIAGTIRAGARGIIVGRNIGPRERRKGERAARAERLLQGWRV